MKGKTKRSEKRKRKKKEGIKRKKEKREKKKREKEKKGETRRKEEKRTPAGGKGKGNNKPTTFKSNTHGQGSKVFI